MKFKEYWKEFYEFIFPPKDENTKKVDYPKPLPAETGFMYAIIAILAFILLFLTLNLRL